MEWKNQNKLNLNLNSKDKRPSLLFHFNIILTYLLQKIILVFNLFTYFSTSYINYLHFLILRFVNKHLF